MRLGKFKFKYHLSAFCLFSVLLAGCVSEDHGLLATGQEGEEKEITFSLKVPGAGLPAPYSLSEADENKVEKVVVLLFDKEKLKYNPRSATVTNNEFTVKIPEGNYDIVVIANADNEVTGLVVGESKATTLAQIEVSHSAKWVTNTASSGYRTIPMWGEIKDFVVGSAPFSTSINLVRMLARIDVNVTGTAQSKFTLESVRLYNYYDKGRIAPIDGYISNNIATAPSIPTGAVKPFSPVNSPLLYTGSEISGNACDREIYTFEAEKSSNSTYEQGTCLVVGGSYQGGTHYYRVDFANNNNYIDLLRNHQYKVAITDVSGAGFSTPEEAFESLPVNITANVLPWDNGDMSEIVFDGQYLMSISKGTWEFNANERDENSTDNTLKIYTDYPGGWKMIKAEDDSGDPITWLDMSPVSGVERDFTKCTLLLDENNKGATRTGYLHIQAGRLNYKIKVTQTAVIFIPVLSIQVSPASKDIYIGTTTLLTATVSPDDASNPEVTWSSSDPLTAEVDENGRVKAIKVGTVTITASADGKSATSTIKVVDGAYTPSPHNGWAGSNIYYDGAKGHLTFDDVGVTTNETVYGVFFRWGNLYGAAHLGTDFTNFTTASTHYPPAGGSATGKSWSDFLHVSETPSTNAKRAYLYEITNENTGKGDICKHLTDKGYAPGYAEGKRWRMPVGNEFGQKTDYVKALDDTGFRNTVSGKGNPFFPLPGVINQEQAKLIEVGRLGHYWSSSPAAYSYGNQAYSMYLDKQGAGSIITLNNIFRTYGASVRCVLEGD